MRLSFRPVDGKNLRHAMRLKNQRRVLLGRLAGFLSILLPLAFWVSFAAEPREKLDLAEGESKAVILSRIRGYIKWPEQKPAAEGTKFIIGIFGENRELEDLLRKLVRAQSADGAEPTVKRVDALEEVKTCHVVFVSRNETERWLEVSRSLPATGILTVGESKDFVDHGLILNIIPSKQAVQLEISLKNAKSAGVSFKPELLRLARVVK
ncbi:MAG: YfiR family protein [Verrucomicrobiales bacterium]|nr:YfiR family protein [Verrucomicrobiales bacterium]